MFDQQNQSSQPVPEDIFDKAEEGNTPPSPLQSSPGSQEQKAMSSLEERSPLFFKNKKWLIIVILAVIIILALAGWFLWRKTMKTEAGKPALKVNSSVNTPVIPTTPVNVSLPPLDTDGDGLTDAEEKTFNTDANKVDSDNDGLIDKDEVKLFKTDPNKDDTDGDGYKDGEEVRAGYNPLGTGRLLQIPVK